MMRYSCFNLNLGEGVSVGLVHIGCAVAFLSVNEICGCCGSILSLV